jgi:hypothetical protein
MGRANFDGFEKSNESFYKEDATCRTGIGRRACLLAEAYAGAHGPYIRIEKEMTLHGRLK